MNALIIGRFQIPNKILKKLIAKARQKGAKKIIVMIGSANEYGTDLNPLSSMLRAHLLNEVLENENGVEIAGIEDLKNDEEWEGRVLIITKQLLKGEDVDFIVTGKKGYKFFKNIEKVTIKEEKITDDDIWKAILQADENKKKKLLDEKILKSHFLHVAAIYLYKIKVKGVEPIYDFDFRNATSAE